MNHFIFIVGGARSGKSRLSVDLAKDIDSKRVVFIATCIPQDEEMKKKVRLHKTRRPRHWKVIEENRKIKPLLTRLKNKFDVIIIDCLGLFISNLLSDGLSENVILKKIESIARSLSIARVTAIVVSNEVGGGIVPEDPIARRFRDLMGLSNQIMSRYADIVYVMQAGIPIKIKNSKFLPEAGSRLRRKK